MNVSLFCIFLTHWLLQMKEFHQSRRSHRLVSVAVMGSKVPLYGSGASLSSTTGMPTLPVPLNLNFVMRSRANVLGNLVKHKYYKRIQCSITLDPKKLGALVSLKNSCTYDWIFMHMVKESVKELLGKKMIIFLLMDSFEIWMELMGIQLRTQKARWLGHICSLNYAMRTNIMLVRLRTVSCDVSDHYIKTFFFLYLVLIILSHFDYIN